MTTRQHRAGRVAAAAVIVALALLPSVAAAQTVQQRYADLRAREEKVHQAIAATSASAPSAERTKVITEARATISAYERFARRYLSSGYADNALFNAGGIAEALHDRFGLTTDRDTALRLYKRLREAYPTASLVKQALPKIARLERLAEANAPVAPPLPSRAPSGKVQLTSIERTVLPELVRITISLEREVPFHQETLEGPARLFFDLKGVEAPEELIGGVLRYPSEVVRQIRVGRHPDAIRVVLDFEEVGRHSVYTLYNPFRIVVDAEPPAAPASQARSEVTSPAPPPAAAAPPPVRIADEEKVVPSVVAATPSESGGSAAATTAPSGTKSAAAQGETSSSRAEPAEAPAPPKVNGAGGFSIARQLGLGVARVVIDPGHGGRDPGAQVKGLKEADVTLDIALRLEKLLKAEPGLEVVLTRREDVYVPLEERTAIANREGADLFLSIHANTSRNLSASGVETYFLSFAASPEAEEVAARENSAHAGEMHKLPDIVKAIALNNKLDESRDFASMVQEALVSRLRRANRHVVNRGVKKAPFVVLIGAEMPSVLAEVAFMTNRQEQQLLKSAAYKQRIAEALHAAVMRYRRALKSVSAIAEQ